MKFTDEQLSRILGEHERGLLLVLGSYSGWRHPDKISSWFGFGCVLQAAKNLDEPPPVSRQTAVFDDNYLSSHSPEHVLKICAAMERAK